MKNVLILGNNSVGLYIFRGDLIRALSQTNKVCASTPDNGFFSEIEELGCRVIETPIDRRGVNFVTDLGLLRRYRAMIKEEKPDLVITYTIKPNIYGGLACRMAKIPYAVNITGLGTAFQTRGALRTLVTFLYKIALKKAKVVFFENAENRQIFIDEKIIPAEKTYLLNGAGVNTDTFSYAAYPESEFVRFLFVGRVMKEKGIDELFAAMERLRSEGENCCLDVLGEYEDNYVDTIKRYETQGWLRYYGHQNDVRPYIEKSHCFVLPSYHEGMANTNLECAAMGRPLITSNIPGCKEAVVAEVSGFLCKPRDSESLYKAMKRFLRLTNAQREAMGQAGRRHMEQVFDKRKVVADTLAALP